MNSVIGLPFTPQLTLLAIARFAKYWPGTGLTLGVVLASLASGSPACASEASVATGSATELEAAPALVEDDDSGQQFDTDILMARGLQPSISLYFHKAARFSPGQNVIDVLINGQSVGRKTVRFSESGMLCFTPAFLHSAGLVSTAEMPAKAWPNASACPGADAVSAQTIVALDPSKASADITTPEQTVAALPAARMAQGGSAAMLNYRASSFANTVAGRDSTRFTQLDSQIGFNWNDWIVRSNQSYANQNGQSRSRFANAYVQKTFVDQKQILQGGLIYTASPMFGGIPMIGAQWIPETALRSQNRYPVTGIAATRARVVITQNGVILLSTVVPPGPFTLSDYQQGNRTGDFQVQVIEENGAEQRFTIAASAILLAEGNAIAGGIYASAGMLSDAGSGNGARAVPLLTFEKGWQYGTASSGSTGALIAGKYASVGAAVRTEATMRGRAAAYAQALAGYDLSDGSSGMLASTAVSWSNASNLQIGISAAMRTARYRSAQEAQDRLTSFDGPRAASMRTQVGASGSWNSTWLGNLNASATHQSQFAAPPSNTCALGWNTAIAKSQFSVGMVRTRQNAVANQSTGQSSDSLFFSVYMPLGRDATLTSHVRSASHSGTQRSVIDAGVAQRLSDTLSYQASVEKPLSESGGESKNISVSALPRYTSMSLGAVSAQDSRGYFAQASGGVILNGQGMAFAANPIQDTFAMVKLGDVAGVKLTTPQGPVWSGYHGLTAIPALLPFTSSTVEIVATSLPPDVDVEHSVQVMRAGHGAVVNLDIQASKVQRVLLAVTFNGAALAESLPVMRGDYEFFTTSLANGHLMLSDFKSDQHYLVQLEDGTTCALRDMQIKKMVTGASFQRGAATCQ